MSQEDPWSGTAADLGGELLACGTPVDQLLAQVAEGRPAADPAHQRSCSACQAALADLRELWAPVHDLEEEDVHAPAGLLEAVLARIRELAADPWYVTVPGPDGDVRVAARVIGAIARLAARRVPEVGLALGRAVPPAAEPPAADDGVPTVTVAVDLSVDYGAPVHLVADAVRRRIQQELGRHTGVAVAVVDVTVVDVRGPARGKP